MSQAFDYILLEQQVELALALQPNLTFLMQNTHGNHVAQKIVDVLPRNELNFVMDCMRGQVAQMSMQQCACRVVQRMLSKGNDQDRKVIFDEVLADVTKLATSQYGNYVTQAVIEIATPEERDRLLRRIMPTAASLSRLQSASNVVEKFILLGNREHLLMLRAAFSSPGEDGRPELVNMMQNQFANYTIRMSPSTRSPSLSPSPAS